MLHTKFQSNRPGGSGKDFLNETGPVVSEKPLENVDDGRLTDDGDYHPIGSCGALGLGELKKSKHAKVTILFSWYIASILCIFL